MTWLAWRQFRAAAAAVAVCLAILAAVLAATGPGMAGDYASGAAACTVASAMCMGVLDTFLNDYKDVLLAVSAAVLALPVLVGLFWGAPLVSRELEGGTHRLVWAQSVTRTRWLAVKLAVVGGAAMAAGAVGGLAVSWWAGPIDEVATGDLARIGPLQFAARGIVPVGYAAFAVLLGVAAGMLLRRTVPAMVLTLGVFAAVQVAMPLLVRPHLVPPVRATVEITRGSLESLGAPAGGSPIRVSTRAPDPSAWLLSSQTVDPAGRAVGAIPLSLKSGPCRSRGDVTPCLAEIKRLGYRQHMVYQPATHYWPMQAIETGVHLGLAAGLAVFCLRRVRRLT
ncbi:ABC transporter permease [Sphaerisporangium sp. B11E5]|uniref:ABC transporter permease n=1 Tax=Sphaerisporangium sp. B11E5 TaxID=3153563 RepID=UPI00325F4262